MDAGGLRGVFSMQLLKALELHAGQPAYELFDLIAGVNAGAVIAFASALLHLPAYEIERLYLQVARSIFNRDPVSGLWDLMTKRGWANAPMLESTLKSYFGSETQLDDFAERRPLAACMAADYSGSLGRTCVFSTYRRARQPYHGSNMVRVWEALRATTAAPFLFDRFTIDGIVLEPPPTAGRNSFPLHAEHCPTHTFLDGGLIDRNPSEIVYLESRALFGGRKKPLLVDIGTGQYEGNTQQNTGTVSLPTRGVAAFETALGTQYAAPIMTELLGRSYY
jgi:patatin-like phospholipase/acyl hydrolase